MTETTAPHMARLWHSRRDGDLITGWLAAMASVPPLRGALCRGKSELFDAEDPADPRTEQALALCTRCPALLACTAGVDGLPARQRPHVRCRGPVAPPTADEAAKGAVTRRRPERWRQRPTGAEATSAKEHRMTYDDFTWGEVTAAVRDGRLAIALAGAPCPMSLHDLEDYDLLGRLRLVGDAADDGTHKINVIARHRGTGKLVRFYVVEPTRLAADAIDLEPPPWVSEHVRGAMGDFHASRRLVWDRLRQLTEIAEVFIGTAKDLETKESAMPAKSEIVSSPRQMRNTAMDLIDAARGDSPYPRLVDRGAHPAVIMAAAAVLVRAAAECTDVGAELVLSTARQSIVEGRTNGTVTALEANVAVTVLQLADPRREDIRVIFDRAESWADTRGLLDSLDVIVAAVDLLRFVTTLMPDPDAVLDGLVMVLMENAERPTEQGEPQ